ncbi:MAG: hypothetical protein ACLQGP_19710 [Isosphaeraceae bacterium]
MTNSRLPAEDSHAVLPRGRGLGVLMVGLATLAVATASGQDIERDPINYSAATPRNVVTRLQDRLNAGKAKLEYESEHGYLRSLLRELDVPISSQVLVFSKTSLQRERISPRTPRAIYFNDDVMIGSCLGGRVIEISAADDAIGTAFYTLDQSREERPEPARQTESCLLCHSSSANQGFPGHLVRSLYVDWQGNPLLSSGSFRTDHSSPLAERWGGWYVTGTSGRQKHMGNLISQGPRRPDPLDNADGVNVVDLKGRFRTSAYLTPHSDIVALMVLEHQAGMLNRLARAGMETRMALHYQREINKVLERPADERSDSSWSRIRNVGESVVQYMLFGDEARLTDRIEGTSSFAADFACRGPRDAKGRSLRDLDLKTRLFRYPCSYLIYSRAFDSLPDPVKDHVYRRLWEILDGRGSGKDDPHLTPEDRRAILEILRETKPDLPDYWKAPSSPADR